jgi:hypothetical protein
MPDFTLEPDDGTADAIPRATRLVQSGLAPTAPIPTARTKDAPPCYGPCADCGAPVLMGMTSMGTVVRLDIGRRTYTVLWMPGEPMPVVAESRSYPVHVCEAVRVTTCPLPAK